MPQLDLFMFFSTSGFMFLYALIFWSLTNYLLKTIIYSFQIIYFVFFNLYQNTTKFFFFYYWLKQNLNDLLIRKIYTYQINIYFHFYACLIIN